MIGLLEEAAEELERAIKIRPDFALAHLRLGCLRLLLGDMARGWRHYEWRFQAGLLSDPCDSAVPVWKGEPLGGATIVLRAEQGLGDTLHFVRYAPRVAGRGGRVVVAAPERLHRLLRTAPKVDRVMLPGDSCAEARWECPLMSLPAIFETRPETAPAQVPYLRADRRQVSKWRARLPLDKLNVGIVWAGSPDRDSDIHRSMPLACLEPLAEVEGLRLFSLQRGAGREQLRRPGMGKRIQDLEEGCRDMADTAAAVMALDVIVSVDTSIAHLAGALGRPVWVMVSHLPDWRWQVRRNDSPWYPTARLFRQTAPGDWLGVARTVAEELRRLSLAKRRATDSALQQNFEMSWKGANYAAPI